MLLFAHTGITLGAAYVLQKVGETRKLNTAGIATTSNPGNLNTADSQTTKLKSGKLTGYSGTLGIFCTELADKVDYRLILVGSLLPDFIDKPLGNIFLSHIFANGRIFAHTLLFLFLILALAIILFQTRKQVWVFYLLFGTMTHFLLDQIWLTPGTLFWPSLGSTFMKYPEMDIITLIISWHNGLITEPVTYIGETVGCISLIFFGIKILVQKQVKAFLLRGTI
jgi:inner membrane protein